MDFTKFDNAVDKNQLQKQIEEAKNNPQGDYREVPAGTYNCKIEKMEIKATKDGRPMFSVMLRIMDGEFKKSCLFMNRVLYGTKNDGNMINSVMGWLKKLEPQTPVIFTSYSEFSELVLDIYDELADVIELVVEYDPDAFNSLSVTDVYDLPF